MEVSYEDIRETFEKIHAYFTYDLKLLSGQSKGGNYITALLIACACETLARFRYGKSNGAQFFAKEMLTEEWRPVAPSLFDAMRNGIAHCYETKPIRIDDKLIDIGISWREHPHLQFSRDKNVLYLNIQTMAEQILKLLQEYESSLKADQKLRLQFSKVMRTNWTKKTKGDELKTWKKLIGAEAQQYVE
jgi:hypothetical protein